MEFNSIYTENLIVKRIKGLIKSYNALNEENALRFTYEGLFDGSHYGYLVRKVSKEGGTNQHLLTGTYQEVLDFLLTYLLQWNKTNDYYNREVVTCDVWRKNVCKGRSVYLQDSVENNFIYTVSFGENSELSFTGSFYNTSVKTLEDAMNYLNAYIPLLIANDRKGIKVLYNSIH